MVNWIYYTPIHFFYSYFEEKFFGGETRDTCVPIDSNNILPIPGINSVIVFSYIIIYKYIYKSHKLNNMYSK